MTGLPPHIPNTAGYKAPPILLPCQQRRTADAPPLKMVEKSRRTGITQAEAFDNVLTTTSSTPAGGVNMYCIAYSQDMTVEYIRACVIWARVFNYAIGEIEEGFWKEDDDDERIGTYTTRFPDSGFRVVALSSCPSDLCGHQGIIVIDEAAFHEQLDKLLKAALAMLIQEGEVRVISTHDDGDSPFNTLIRGIRAGRQGGNVHRITFRKVVSGGLLRRVCLRTGKEWSGVSEQA